MKPNRLEILLLSIFLITSCTSSFEKRGLLIATAANVQFAMEELTSAFEEETGIETELVINSSGKITAQAMAGAPYDVFVSADLLYPQTLAENGLVSKGPEVYAEGQLVLWSVDDRFPPEFASLKKETLSHIALASPETAPYGRAAKESLHHYELLENISEKLVFGESISQTNQFIISGAAPMGFTALSVVKSPSLKQKGSWMLVPSESYSPIQQGIVVLKQSPSQEQAASFYLFMFSESAQSILQKYGYEIPETPRQ